MNTKEPHRVENPDGSVTVYLGHIEFKVGPRSAPQPTEAR
jgi:hypothetical protein